jgi:solute carrier family 8 (sodium/calcium exchanger)
MTKHHSHAWYRIGATRVFTGSKKVKPQLSIKLQEVNRIQSFNYIF